MCVWICCYCYCIGFYITHACSQRVGLKRKKKVLGFVCYFPLVVAHKNKTQHRLRTPKNTTLHAWR